MLVLTTYSQLLIVFQDTSKRTKGNVNLYGASLWNL